MNYYYDVILNWNDNIGYEFYEWNDTDYLELIKKIPLIRVSHKLFMDVLTNNIEVDPNFLNEIKDKTFLSSKSIIKRISYACLITDNKNVYALEFNELGHIISRSKLLIDDELNVLEASYNLKENNFNYQVLEPIPLNYGLRQIKEVINLISLELQNLYENKETAKLKYLYYEYKQEKIDDIEIIYQKIHSALTKEFNPELLKLYYIIKLSYHNV